jgi:uncharacterized membrane protein YjjB (DUF3815 family)
VILTVVLQDAFWSAWAACGFAVLFNVPQRTLIGCMLCGAVGHSVRTLLMMQFDVQIAFATLAGAAVIGFMGLAMSRYWKAPMTVFTVSGSIPMVPGVFAYQTMLGILRIATTEPQDDAGLLVETVQSGINTALVLAGIAVGIIAPRLLFLRMKPIV